MTNLHVHDQSDGPKVNTSILQLLLLLLLFVLHFYVEPYHSLCVCVFVTFFHVL